MPYKSEKQRRFMHAKHPDIARRWDAEYGKKVSKADKPLTENQKLRRQKKTSATMSVIGGTTGSAALGTLGASAALKNPKIASRMKDVQATREKLLRTSGILTTVGAGVGAPGAFNYAMIQNREANKLRVPKEQKVAKALRALPAGPSARVRTTRVMPRTGSGPGPSRGKPMRAKNPQRRARQEYDRLNRTPGTRSTFQTEDTSGISQVFRDLGMDMPTATTATHTVSRGKQGGRWWNPRRAEKSVEVTRGTRPGPTGDFRSADEVFPEMGQTSYRVRRAGPTAEAYVKGTTYGGAGLIGGGIAANTYDAYKNSPSRKKKVKKSMDEQPYFGIDLGLGSVHQGRNVLLPEDVSKARYYDPEERRNRRLDAYTGLSAGGAGAAGVGAIQYGRRAVGSRRSANDNFRRAGEALRNLEKPADIKWEKVVPKKGQSKTEASALQSAINANKRATAAGNRANDYKHVLNLTGKGRAHNAQALRSAGKASGLGLAAIGLGVGAQQINRYKRRGGRTYPARTWS